MEYPVVRRDPAVVEELQGMTVSGPNRWLKDPDSRESQDFLENRNVVTNLGTKLHDNPRCGVLNIEGDSVYYMANRGLRDQAVIFRQKSIYDNFVDKDSEVFFDPNTLSEDDTTGLIRTSWSEDGKMMAYMLTVAESDWRTIKILDAASKENLADVLERVKFPCLAWAHDHKGFFYNMYPEVTVYSQKPIKLYYHVLGTPQSEDVLCAEFPDNPSWIGSLSVSDDGHYVIMNMIGSGENALFYCDLRKVHGVIRGTVGRRNVLNEILLLNQPELFQGFCYGPWVRLFKDFDAQYDIITSHGSLFFSYIKSNLHAKDKWIHRILVVDVGNPDKITWTVLISESPKYDMKWACYASQGKLIVYWSYYVDFKNLYVMSVYDLSSGNSLYTLDLGCRAVVQVSCKKKLSQFFFKIQSLTNPGTVYVCDFSKTVIEPIVGTQNS